jgi:methionine-rich copper-binding protein CopC
MNKTRIPSPVTQSGSDTRMRCAVRLPMLIAAAVLVPLAAGATPRHARSSSPAADAIIHGRHAEYVVRFDGPVDHRSCRMIITQSGQVIQSLPLRLDSAPDVLIAEGQTPPPGKYFLHWETRSTDGDASSGDIPFSVAP